MNRTETETVHSALDKLNKIESAFARQTYQSSYETQLHEMLQMAIDELVTLRRDASC